MQEIVGGDYESVKNMIYKLALNKYSAMRKKRPDVEFDDVLSEAMYIYSLCLTTYKGGKGMKFSTFLYQNLVGRLKDFYNHQFKVVLCYEDLVRQNDKGNMVDKSYEASIESVEYELDENTKEMLEVAKEELSFEGYTVLKYIVSMEWQKGKIKNFPKNTWLATHFGYSLPLMDSIMGEIKSFWNNQGYLIA